jgi:SAM-dependent methyltransferase
MRSKLSGPPRRRPGRVGDLDDVEFRRNSLSMSPRTCRACSESINTVFADLGTSPFSNAFLTREQLSGPETHYPLCVYVCEKCWLVQIPAFERPEAIFNEDYLYFSSFSSTWLSHARAYADRMIPWLALSEQSLVVEVASNDGYLLQYFAAAQIGTLGIEPSQSVADAAVKAHGIPTLMEFFGSSLAQRLASEGKTAELMVANNVLAHVPDLHDFVEGFRILLKPEGVATFEFPHLLRLIEDSQFDTIYHEHFCYFSLLAIEKLFSMHQLKIFDVEELPTHGGSLRVFVTHSESTRWTPAPSVEATREKELSFGLAAPPVYLGFQQQIEQVRADLLSFLLAARKQAKMVVGYGAPAKGNTLFNYSGVRKDLVSWVVDKSPEKQGRFLPGTRLPVFAPDEIRRKRPDYVLILPWNLKKEIMTEMADISSWGGKFVIAIPKLEILE